MSVYEDESMDGAEEGIAVIGMSGAFPGAPDIDTFWRNLREGREGIVRFTKAQMTAAGVPEEEMNAPSYAPFGAPLDGVEQFDADFFGFTPREAEIMDPQQRVFLQSCYHALEDAGYVPGTLPDRVGVFGGSRVSDYLTRHLYANSAVLEQVGPFQAILSNDKDYLTPLVSYKLDLGGPSICLQTACSTSLVSVHFAAESLLGHNCNLALAGGVTIRLPQHAGYHAPPGGIFSPTGQCRAFDAAADGTVFGNGVGVVVLKRLEDALEDKDQIYGVVLGSAVNNDGGRKVGLTAPSAEGQARVIADALAICDREPADISFIECHGTGTNLGDAIEVAALAKVFGDATHRCALGAVKTSVGHLEAAAGMAGLIKVLLMLKHRRLVPSLHFENPNPQIGFQHTPFYVNTEDCPWETPDDQPLVAGLSSFGIGGTNAHIILGEAPEAEPAQAQPGPHLLCLSAKSESALTRMTQRLADHLEAHPHLALDAVAATLKNRRETFDYRFVVVANDSADAAQALRNGGARSRQPQKPPTLVFLFPGQGAQYPGMARDLYQSHEVFRETLERGARLLEPQLGRDILPLLLGDPSDQAAVEQLDHTELTQPALFLVNYALASQWLAWGVEPAAMLGHSVGELVAASLAGVFDFETGLKLMVTRGKLAESCPPGSMLSVALSPERLAPFLGRDIEIAAFNGPELTVVSGPDAALKAMAERLKQGGVEVHLLHTSHAFHSAALEPAQNTFEAYLRQIPLSAPKRRFISNITGTWITEAQATDPAYWAQHLRKPVRFAQGLETIASLGNPFWLEVGPGRSATSMARTVAPGSLAATSLPGASSTNITGTSRFLEARGRLWMAGFEAGPPMEGSHVSLPGYPFAADTHWVAAGQLPGVGASVAPATSRAETPTRAEHMDQAVPPEGEVETIMVQVWEEALGVRPIGRFDDFFDLGGHSLLATRVLGRLAQQNIHLTLNDFFDGAQLHRLAGAASREAAETQALVASDQPPVMTAAQERFWFLFQLAPQDPSYNLPGAFPINGPLSVPALEGAVNDLAERQEIMRWIFPAEVGKPTVKVLPPQQQPLTLIDISHLPAHQQGDVLTQIRARDAWTPFDLEREMAWRTTLVRRQPQQHDFLMNIHHIISDGGSFSVLSRDLSAAMHARLTGETLTLPQLAVQYGDFAHWQRQKLNPSRRGELDKYWMERLGDAPLVFDMDTDFDRPKRVDARGGRAGIHIDAATTAALHQLGRSHNAGMFMCLMTAFQALLWNRTGKELFLVGTDVTHRNHAGLENLVGLFVNQLVLRAELHGDPSLTQLLGRVRGDVLGAFAHQDLPFERLVELLKPARDLGRTPVYQVRFVYQNHPPVAEGHAGFSGADADEKDIATRHDMRLEMHERDGKLGGFLEYRKSLFAHETMEHLADQFTRLIHLMAHEAATTLSQVAARLTHVPPTTARLMRNVMAGEAIDVPHLPPQWLTQGAKEHPHRPALVCDISFSTIPAEMTYRELQEAAAQLGYRLHARGVRTDDVVGLYMDRSSELILGCFGTWAAGAGFMPLDRKSPESWLEFQVSQSGCRHILTLSCWVDQLPQTVRDRCTVILLDGDTSATPVDLPPTLPHQTAYVLFTSGSTGKSKAVAVTQHNLASYSEGVAQRIGKRGGSWAFVQAAVGDSWLTGLTVPIMNGGSILALSPEAVSNPEQYLTFTQEHPVDCLKIMPSVFKAIQGGGRFEELLPSDVLILGGEPAEVAWVQAMSASRPKMRIFNHFGITETTIGNVLRRLDGNRLDGLSAVPMGQALGGVRAYVVDGLDRAVAPGMRGELHLAGSFLSRGYLGQPGLTATRFLPDPWSIEPGSRRYATGDVVRTDDKAELYFWGRADQQVKIRGFRVEPGEVENQLRQTGKIAMSVVRLIKGRTPFLAAYVVPRKEVAREGFEDELRTWLQQRVPAAMVPSVFVVLDQMPYLPNGKINLKALPIPELGGSEGGRQPETPLERQLAAIWAQVLERETVGADDNFFLLGGDSLLSIRVIALANRANLPLSTEAFFRNQTLADQAVWLEQQGAGNEERAIVALQPGGRRTPLFCIHAAGGMIYNYIELSRALGPDQPLYALQDPAFMGMGTPGNTIDGMADRYLAEILETEPQGPYQLAGHSMGGLVAYEIARRLQQQGREVVLVAMFDTRAPGRVGEGQDPDQHLVVLHHLLDVMFRGQGQTPPVDMEDLRPLTHDDRLTRVSIAIRTLPGCADLTPDRLTHVVAAYMAHVEAAQTYRGNPYEGPVLLYRPKDQIQTTPESGWQPHAPNIQEIEAEGDHTTMLARGPITSLANSLNTHLLKG